MKLLAARVRRKVARDREHVLACRVRLDSVVCGWSRTEPEPLLRSAGVRWSALVLRVHHRIPTAGLRRDHVSFGLGLVVAENTVFDRRGSARCRCLSAARTAGHQVPTTTITQGLPERGRPQDPCTQASQARAQSVWIWSAHIFTPKLYFPLRSDIT